MENCSNTLVDVPVASCTNFDEIARSVAGTHNAPVELAGATWNAWFFDTPSLRRLTRDVTAGKADIREWSRPVGNGGFHLTVTHPRCSHVKRSSRHESLADAAVAAEAFRWEIREHADLTWYVEHLSVSSTWTAILADDEQSVRDVVVVSKTFDGIYNVSRKVSPRSGASYEVSFSHYGDQAVRSFEEAVAIVLTLPTFVATLATKL
ncbi:hypothetical protein [Burkholderia pyrrocinia]|uniref:hypothetical protein n=1 Tax=Burkholderia pyrrocinia TaxID=60550 RepID=UPI001BCC9A0A|nr:hypothetical protein [Burkholderia pyrrocinia]QVN18946.1 hypothetical protein JYG32_04195 [Burkholderia pyrrocinia]